MPPSSVNQRFRLVRENVYGTTPASPAWRNLNAFMLDMGPTPSVDFFQASGETLPSISILEDEYTSGDITGRACFESMTYPLASMFGDASVTTPAGATNMRQWDWGWDGRTPRRFVSFTVHKGSSGQALADEAKGCLFNGLSLEGDRDGFDLKSSIYGLKLNPGVTLGGATNEVQTVTITGSPTGGTFTLGFKGQTTSPISWNAAASAVQTALNALGSIFLNGVGVVVAGGPGPGTPYTVTFVAADLAGVNVPTMTAAGSFTGGTSPAVAVTETTPGADTATEVTPRPISPLHWSVYLNDSWAALGTTKLLDCYKIGLDLGEMSGRTRPVNASLSSDSYIEAADSEHTIKATLAYDAVGRDILATTLRNQSMKFLRAEAVGPLLAGEGANPYRLQMNFAVFVQDLDKPTDLDGIYIQDVTFRLGRDSSSGNAAAITLVNRRTTL